ncbi:MAG: sensor histidine kinase [Bauldia sp.]|nr:sensor histidine kinase [Bauldia sp.]
MAETVAYPAPSAALAEELIAGIREPMLALDFGRNVSWANRPFYAAFGMVPANVEGCALRDLGGGLGWNDATLATRLAILSNGGPSTDTISLSRDFDPIGRRSFAIQARRVERLKLLILVVDDVTEKQAASTRTDALLAEVAHRAKNILAVVQSLAYQTSAPTVDAFRTALIGRIKALALAQGALIETQWQGAELSGLISSVVNAHNAEDSEIVIDGPSVRLSSLQATTFALIINELASNALEHGAMSTPAGRVSVTWQRAADRLILDWRESGGPPVTEGGDAGFGTTLIRRAAALQLGGSADLDFAPAGLSCHIELALSE